MANLIIRSFDKSAVFEDRLQVLLRIGIWMCFVGHGFWGLVQKSGWLIFFRHFNISDEIAYYLMPLIGAMDIAVGFAALMKPTKALLIWASFWTVFTALLRPIVGMGFSEFFERAGNYGVPIAFLFIAVYCGAQLTMTQTIRTFPALKDKLIRHVEIILRLSLFSLLAGHAGLALFANSQTLLKNLSVFSAEPAVLGMWYFGIVEMGLAFVVLFFPRIKGLMWFVLLFKLGTELLFPISGQAIDIFETIERGGDYVIPLMLYFIYRLKP